jgi:Protein of unknown function (DUF1552)
MKTSRRDILGALGLGAVMSPFVPYLARRAEAQGFPKRVLLLFTGCGSVPDQYWPTGGETDFQFNKITEPLAPFKSKLIFPKGMSRVRNGPGGHESAMVCLWTASSRNPGSPFGGYAKSPSVDQVIAKKLPAGQTTFPSLEFGVQHDGPGANSRLLSVMCYAGSDQPIQPESSPYKMFDRLMLGSATAPTGIKPEDLAKMRERRKSSLDIVRDELQMLNARLDTADRLKMEQHLEGLSAIEKRLLRPIDAPTLPAAMGCGAPGMKMGIDLKANASFPELLALQNSLCVAALACNRTRVASLQWSRAFTMVQHTWLNVNTGHHTLSHNTSAQARVQQAAIEHWYMQRMAELLKQMDSIQEGDGTLLDNTMLIYANELTVGAAHNVSPPITLVAGSCGKQLKTGRLVELGGFDFSQLLLTACRVMGVNDVSQIGDLGKPGHIPALMA